MFQSFDVTSEKSESPARVTALRERMAELGIDAFIVPHSDEHQNEYLPKRAERLAWITGFTGSAGAAVILADSAHVFSDGRYTVQLREQTDENIFQRHDLPKAGPSLNLKEWAEKDMRVGIDPWLHTMSGIAAFEEAAKETGATLVKLDDNPLDAIWTDQPEPPKGKVTIHDMQYAGVQPKQKLNEIAKSVREAGADVTVLTDPTSICWAFNIRGEDLSHMPLVLSFAIIQKQGEPMLFLDESKLDTTEEAYLTQLARLAPMEELEAALASLGEAELNVLLDPSLVAAKIAETLEASGATIIKGDDPCRLPRACKNRIERKGAMEAQKRDGAAMVEFLCWMDSQKAEDLNEIKIAQKLEQIRINTGNRLGVPLKEISFDTISAAGPHAALPHYRVNTESNRQVSEGDLVLVDSGGQYEDGTTDITRVIPIGEPADDKRRHFTLVLKGMIAISEAKFPVGTRGIDIDGFARQALWAEGFDYAHGTGHGVGSYLGVHEGPQGIHRRAMVEFQPGMIVSNEPGYYKEGSHGIRIENILVVNPTKVPEGGDIEMLSFTTLTLCPIDRRLIDVSMLTVAEKRWVNSYHSKVRTELSKLIEDEDTLHWLEKATRRIKRV